MPWYPFHHLFLGGTVLIWQAWWLHWNSDLSLDHAATQGLFLSPSVFAPRTSSSLNRCPEARWGNRETGILVSYFRKSKTILMKRYFQKWLYHRTFAFWGEGRKNINLEGRDWILRGELQSRRKSLSPEPLIQGENRTVLRSTRHEKEEKRLEPLWVHCRPSTYALVLFSPLLLPWPSFLYLWNEMSNTQIHQRTEN